MPVGMNGNNKEIGVPGLYQFSGIIRQDFLKEMWGKEAYKRFLEMKSNSPVIGALLLAIEQMIRGVTFSYTSIKGDNDPRLRILHDSWDNMAHSVNDHIIEALSFLPFGFAMFEIVYQRVKGKILWKKFAPRGQGTVFRWLFNDDTGELEGFVQHAPPKWEMHDIPMERLLLYRAHIELGNPEGRSILRTAWTSYYYMKHIQQVEAIGIERDLAGMPVVYLPQNATTSNDENDEETDSGKANRLVRRLRNDDQAGAVLPFGWELKLMSTGGSRQFDTNAIISRYESRILMSALAQFLMLGQAGSRGGSRAQTGDEIDFFTASVNAVADILTDTHTKFAIPRLMALNGEDPTGLKFEHSGAGQVDITKLADFLQKTNGFVTWTPTDESWLRDVGRLPSRTPQEIAEAQADVVQQQVDSPSAQPPTAADTTVMSTSRMRSAYDTPLGQLAQGDVIKFNRALARFEAALLKKNA